MLKSDRVMLYQVRRVVRVLGAVLNGKELFRYGTQDPNLSSHLVEHCSVRFNHDDNSLDEYKEPSFPLELGLLFRSLRQLQQFSLSL